MVMPRKEKWKGATRDGAVMPSGMAYDQFDPTGDEAIANIWLDALHAITDFAEDDDCDDDEDAA